MSRRQSEVFVELAVTGQAPLLPSPRLSSHRPELIGTTGTDLSLHLPLLKWGIHQTSETRETVRRRLNIHSELFCVRHILKPIGNVAEDNRLIWLIRQAHYVPKLKTYKIYTFSIIVLKPKIFKLSNSRCMQTTT